MGSCVAPWLYRACIERGGRPGVCSDDENAHPCEISQLRIVRMTPTVFAWALLKTLDALRVLSRRFLIASGLSRVTAREQAVAVLEYAHKLTLQPAA